MKRRQFLFVLSGAMAATRDLAAEQKTMPMIGFLGSTTASAIAPFLAACRLGLSETGYVEGRNVTIEYRWAESRYDRLPALAADLVSRKVDLIIAVGGAPPALAAKNATSTIPIVFTSVGDPVGAGLVASLARPGGNLTGFSNMSVELLAKLVQLLSELLPQAKVIALLVNPSNVMAERVIRSAQEAARAKAVQLAVLRAGTEGEIDAAFASFNELRASGLVVDPDPFFVSRHEQVVALASRHAVPAVYGRRQFIAAGGLISYDTNVAALYHQAGLYAGKILNGAKPADLPVQQPTKFELVVNLNTAKALGLTVPPSILARADEVIE